MGHWWFEYSSWFGKFIKKREVVFFFCLQKYLIQKMITSQGLLSAKKQPSKLGFKKILVGLAYGILLPIIIISNYPPVLEELLFMKEQPSSFGVSKHESISGFRM